MATTYQYPTPPPTISPKNEFPISSSSQQSHEHPSSRPSKLPAQESYFHSAPSPTITPYKPKPFNLPDTTYANPNPIHPHSFNEQDPRSQIQPPRRRSSPLVAVSPKPYSRVSTPPSRKRTPVQHHNPIYFSPTNPIPSPYSASRPQPRPGGVLTRLKHKLTSYIRKFAQWAQNNPIKAGFLTFIPVLGAAGIMRLFGGFTKLVGGGKTSVDKFIEKSRGGIKESAKAKKEGKKLWGWGLDEFVGFNGSKGGPLDGMLRMMQMWVNHICRVTPSMIPRTMAIILELYFLELEK